MLPRIFIDTSAFLALEDESDQYHDEAMQFHEQVLRRRRYEIVTTSYILDETLTLIRFRVGINASIDFSKKLRKSEVVKIVRVSRKLFTKVLSKTALRVGFVFMISYASSRIEEESLDIFERYDDKDFSFTDCVSFVVMREMGIKEAFAFDQHFNQMGFVRKP